MKDKVIQVDGKFYIKVKVVMLPTEKASNVYIGDMSSDLLYCTGGKKKIGKNQHLYFLSEEEVSDVQYTRQFPNISTYKSEYYLHDENKVLGKIIATTDESLINHTPSNVEYILPKPSNDFLQAHCKANGKIDEVLVEVGLHTVNVTGGVKDIYEIKVAPDNTVTIKPVNERVYARDEVIALHKANCERLTNYYTSSDIDWIEKNL